MTSNPPNFNPEQAHALRRLRLRWLVTLAAIVPLPFVVLTITGSAWLKQQPGSAANNAMVLAIVVVGTALLAGLFARNQTYKAHWRGEVIEPEGYLKANTRFFAALLVGAAGLFLISILMYPAPSFAAAVIFVGLLVFNFPNGRPMLPAPPRLGSDGDNW